MQHSTNNELGGVSNPFHNKQIHRELIFYLSTDYIKETQVTRQE